MTALQRLQLEQSKTRERLNALLGQDELTDDERGELGTLTTRAQQIEVEMRAAIVAEPEPETRETPEGDAETRELRELEQRATVAGFVAAAMSGTPVRGAELEYSQALEMGGRFPLSMLAPEVEQRATTDADSAVSQAPWLDRLFANTAAMSVGVSMRSVGNGVASYPVTTAGAAGAQRARSEAAADAAWTVGVTEIKPKRNAVRAVFSIEDAARLPGLEDALRRDLGMALTEAIDRAIFVGDAGSQGNAADIVGLNTAGIGEVTLKQSAKVKGPDTLAAFAGLIDGIHAGGAGDLRVVAAVGANTLWLSTLANARDMTIGQFLRANGVNFTVRGDIEAATTAGKFGAFVGLGRGIDGAAVAAVWESADLIRDPYSNASEGEVALTLSTLWGFEIPRPANFRRLKFVA